MNRGLVEYLNEYTINPDPQYAIMINGKWGCGKTFFIKDWLKKYEDDKNNVDKILKPIYVSLYGLKEIEQITSAINRVLYPYMYGKLANISKAVWKCASALVFKQEVNLNDDKQNDISINIGLDSLSILKSDDETIKSDKFLIFDDIERCQVDMTELLGYINYFVEHCHCRVLIIGDESQLGKKDKEVFEKFKEKTIGREFLLRTELDEAIDFFVKEELNNPFLISHIEDIKKTFEITECNNLRILRQCLWDFYRLKELVEYNETDYYDQVMTSLLCSFIAVYCEYKGENNIVLRKWKDYKKILINTENDKDAKDVNKTMMNIQNKYTAYPSYTVFPIFDFDIVDRIIVYIESGISIVDFVNKLIIPKQIYRKPSWERCHEALIMSNDEFVTFCNELIDDIVNVKVLNLKDLGNSVAYVSFCDTKKIYSLNDEQKSDIRNALPKYLHKFKTLESCYDEVLAFRTGVYLFVSDIEMPVLSYLCEYFYLEFERRKREDKNELTKLLEGLNDDNSEVLFELNGAVLPDKTTTYDSVSIFHLVDIDLLFLSIKSMGNKGRQHFNSFIRQRYRLNSNLGNWIHETQDDIAPLVKLKKKVDEEIPKRELVDKYSLEMISNSILGAIRRCEGDKKAQN